MLMYLGEFDDKSRSREGAWIEILNAESNVGFNNVAPVRERGLKFLDVKFNLKCIRVAPVRERGLK